VSAPNGVRVLAEGDLLDGGSFWGWPRRILI
jgi:hypothetical protein